MGHVGSGGYLRRATELVRRSVLGWLGIAHIGGVSILGLYLALSAVEGAVYHYSFLYEQAPPTAAATSGAILGYAVYGLVASTVAYLTYAWMLAYALATVQRKPGLAWALRRVARSAPHSAWWGIPASIVVSASGLMVLPSIVVPVFARLGLERLSTERRGVASRRTHRTWAGGVPLAIGLSLLWVVGLTILSAASNRSHLQIGYIIFLSACGWLLFSVTAVLASVLATACALKFEDEPLRETM